MSSAVGVSEASHVVGRASPADNFADALRLRATAAPSAVAFVFVDAEEQEETLTYGELHERAEAVAAALIEGQNHDQPVLLLYPPGREYVVGLFGCFYAGVAAVPAFPPDPSRLERTLPRLSRIVADAGVQTVLTMAVLEPLVEGWSEQLAAGRRLATVATDSLTAPARLPARTHGDSPALLQYTSGSTSDPRGVMVRHRQLVTNSDQIHRIMDFHSESKGVIWVPPYHDLGLVGGILQPIYAGVPSVMLSPIDFLRRPILWLRAVTRHGGTVSGGPNFAYDLCVRRIGEDERAQLDLSSWELAFSGGEPAVAHSIDAFCDAFGPSGFRRAAMYPSYGLAEATLLVTGGTKLGGPRVAAVGREALEREGLARSPREGEPAREIVSNGGALHGVTLAIVDPETRAARSEDEVGEIWVRGPQVSDGYWGRPGETEAVFGVVTAEGDGPYLRTGDLGFLRDDDLFVTGRLKDLIVINGRNLDPIAIEKVCDAVPGIRRGCAAAFAIGAGEGTEQLTVVLETSLPDDASFDELLSAVRREISAEIGVPAAAIGLIGPRTLPKTSSGKTQRWLARRQWEHGELDLIASWPPPATGRDEAGLAYTPQGDSR